MVIGRIVAIFEEAVNPGDVKKLHASGKFRSYLVILSAKYEQLETRKNGESSVSVEKKGLALSNLQVEEYPSQHSEGNSRDADSAVGQRVSLSLPRLQ
jgi:hypothetical protein